MVILSISMALAWSLLFVLAILVVLTFRQIAYLMGLDDAMNPHRAGLSIGRRVPTFRYRPFGGGTGGELRAFPTNGTASAVLFADPGCGSCDIATQALATFARDEELPLNAFVFTEATERLLEAHPEFLVDGPIIGQVSRGTGLRVFECGVIPFMFFIDSDQIVRAKGAVASVADVRRLYRQASESIAKVATKNIVVN